MLNFLINNATSVAVRIFMSKQSKQQGFKKLTFLEGTFYLVSKTSDF